MKNGACGCGQGVHSHEHEEHEEEWELEDEARYARGRGSNGARGGRLRAAPVARAKGRPATAPKPARRTRPWIFQRARPRPWIFGPALPAFTEPPAVEPPRTLSDGADGGGSTAPPAAADPPDDAAAGAGASDDGATSAASAEPSADAGPDQAAANGAADGGAATDSGAEQGELSSRAFRTASSASSITEIAAWRHAPITSFPASVPAGGGVYVVERAGRPLFVGEAASFRADWGKRLLALYQIGVVERGRAGPPFPISVWFGTIVSNSPTARAQVRQALVGALTAGGFGAALRSKPTRQGPDSTNGSPGPLTIKRLLPPPWLGRARGVVGLRGNTLVIDSGAPDQRSPRRPQRSSRLP